MIIETPIRHLLPYISIELEHISEALTEVVKDITQNGQSKIRIKLDSDSTRFDTPAINENGVIAIGESFLYYYTLMKLLFLHKKKLWEQLKVMTLVLQ